MPYYLKTIIIFFVYNIYFLSKNLYELLREEIILDLRFFQGYIVLNISK